MKKRILSLLLAVVMIVGLLPTVALADGTEPTTPTDSVVSGSIGEDGWEQKAPENTPVSGVVSVNKTAAPTNNPNEYTVTLTVVLEETETTTLPGAAATVLVLDCSGSMAYCSLEEHRHTHNCYGQTVTTEKVECTATTNRRHWHYNPETGDYEHNTSWMTGELWGDCYRGEDGKIYYDRVTSEWTTTCGKTEHTHGDSCDPDDARIKAAKTAAISFVKAYSGLKFNTDGTLDATQDDLAAKRYVSLVSFATKASANAWVDVSTKKGYKTAVDAINALRADGGTNLDAGLRYADYQLTLDAVKDIPVAAKNVIALTDGEPTYYCVTGSGKDSFTIGGVSYKVQGDGNACNQNTFQTTKSTATTLKAKVSGLYTVCFGAANNTIRDYDKGNNQTITVGDYLRDKIATRATADKTYAYNANDTQGLMDAFKAISSSITEGLSTGKVVLDTLPVGVSSDDIVSGSNNAYEWELDSAGSPFKRTVKTENGKTIYTYTYSYTVKIDPANKDLKVVEIDGEKYAPLNGQTTLTVGDNNVIYFPIPAGKVTYPDPVIAGATKTVVEAAPTDIPAGTDYTGIYQWPEVDDTGYKAIEAKVGDKITILYKIIVTGDAGAEFTVVDADTTLFYSATTLDTTTAGTYKGTIPADATSVVFYVTKEFTVEADTTALSNGITVNGNDGENPPDVPVSKVYTLTYHPNGGTLSEDMTNPVTGLAGTATPALDYTNIPTHAKQGESDVVFIGWTAAVPVDGDAGHVYTKAEAANVPAIISEIAMNNSDQTVYAVWGLDTNGDGTPDIYDAIVQYKIVNGTWSDDTTTKEARFAMKTRAADASTWTDVNPTPVLGSTIPDTDKVKPNSGYTTNGSWDVPPAADTPVVDGTIYTYTLPEVVIPPTPASVDSKEVVTDYDSLPGYVKDEIPGINSKYPAVQYPVKDSEGNNTLKVPYGTTGISLLYKITVSRGAASNSTITFYDNAHYLYSEDAAVTTSWDDDKVAYRFDVAFNEGADTAVIYVWRTHNLDFDADGKCTVENVIVGTGKKAETTVTEEDPNSLTLDFSSFIKKHLTVKGSKNFTGADFTAKLTGYTTPTASALADGAEVEPELFTDYLYVSFGSNEGNTTKLFLNSVGTHYNWTFTKEDIGLTYHFAVEEVIPAQTGNITYDTSKYYFDVEVEVDEDGQLYTRVYFLNSSNFDITFYNEIDTGSDPYYPWYPVIKDDGKLNKDDHFAYIIGYPDGTVHPNGEITRAEVATIFFRLLKDDVRNAYFTSSNPYSDVTAGKWFNNPVSTMSALGIIKGYPDGTFRPDAPITRAEFAAIAARFDESTRRGTTIFSDVYGHWAADEIAKAYDNGWIKGYPDGTFRPNRNITRAEAMTLINRVLDRAPESPSDLLPDMNKWSDNMDTSKWYYLAVQEATNSHDYTRKTFNYEMWKRMLLDPDWSRYER